MTLQATRPVLHLPLQDKTCTAVTGLMKRERGCLADPNYLATVQRGRVTEHMRSVLLDWLFELVDGTVDGGGMEVYPAAVSILDRYLSLQPVAPGDLQDTGLSALLCASRLVQGDNPMRIGALENYYRIGKLRKLEQHFLITIGLTPDSLVLPTHYFPHFTDVLRDGFAEEEVRDVECHAYNLIPVFYSEYESVLHPPSVISGACILESVRRLLGEEAAVEVLANIVTLTRLHPNYFMKAMRDLRRWISKMIH